MVLPKVYESSGSARASSAPKLMSNVVLPGSIWGKRYDRLLLRNRIILLQRCNCMVLRLSLFYLSPCNWCLCQLFDDYENIVAAQRADDSAEAKSESRRQRLQLLGQAVKSFEKAIELEDSMNLTDRVRRKPSYNAAIKSIAAPSFLRSRALSHRVNSYWE